MSIASLNQTGLTSSNLSSSYRSDQFSLSTHHSTVAFDDFSGNFTGNFTGTFPGTFPGTFSRTTEQLLRNASFVSRLPSIAEPNRTAHARSLSSISAENRTDHARNVSSMAAANQAGHTNVFRQKQTTSKSTKVSSSHSSKALSKQSQNITTTDKETTDNTNPLSSIKPTGAHDTREPLLDNPLIFTILIGLLVLWNIYGFFVQIKLLFFTETKASTNQVFDNCTLSSSYFKYMVRVSYSNLIGGYQPSAATLMVDLLDTKDQFVTRFTIPPALFTESSKSSKKSPNGPKTIKLRLNRRNEFPEIGSLRITHDVFVPNGSAIHVQSVQLKDLTHNKLTNVPINRPIKALGPDAKFTEQLYEANKPMSIDPDEDMFNDGIAPNVTLTELLMFIFIFTNLSMLSTLLLRYTLGRGWPVLIIAISMVANLVSLVLLVGVMKLYQYTVKERFILKIGSNKWRLIRILFVIVTLNFSVIMTLFSFWLITLLKRQLTLLFLACSGTFIALSILVLVTIYSLNHFKINKKLKLKQSSLTALTEGQVTREKTSLQTPNMELFVLRTKAPNVEKR